MSSAYREAAGVLDVVLSRKRGLRAAAMAPEVKNKFGKDYVQKGNYHAADMWSLCVMIM